MNNQSNLFEDIRGFILDTPKDMKLDFFFLTFGICCVFLQLKPLLPMLELIGILLPFHFFCFYIAFLKVFLDGPQSMAFLLLALSQSLDFCPKPFFYPLVQSMSSKYLSFTPSVGCDPSQGFYEKNILSSSKWDYKGYNF